MRRTHSYKVSYLNEKEVIKRIGIEKLRNVYSKEPNPFCVVPVDERSKKLTSRLGNDVLVLESMNELTLKGVEGLKREIEASFAISDKLKNPNSLVIFLSSDDITDDDLLLSTRIADYLSGQRPVEIARIIDEG